MDREAIQCPYIAGNTLVLQIDGEPYSSANATIIDVFEPFTLSCAMSVQFELDQPPLKSKCNFVLKLYDRRFATQLRRDEKACPWNPEIESEFQEFVRNGSASSFYKSISENLCCDEDWAATGWENWNRAQQEAYLQYRCRQFYKTETEVYDRLLDIQGTDIPRLSARILVKSSTTSNSVDECLDCPGILLEFIQGFPLTELANYAPRDTWQHVCEEAIRIINCISDRNIRNEDVKTRSFIVRKDPVTSDFKVLMIDFGACVFRKPDQDDRDWREWKAMQDEEGAIGLVMESKLEGGFKYTRTPGSEELQVEFQSEE